MKKKTKVKQAKEVEDHIYQIKEKVVFTFAHEHNARNVAYALSMAGYFVRITGNRQDYEVRIYNYV